MDLGINDRLALVLGATSGLGRAIAASLAAEGAQVVAVGRRSELLSELSATVPNVTGIRADLSRQADVAELLETVTDKWGSTDILVLNSGGPPPGNVLSVNREDMEKAANLLLHPMHLVLQGTIPDMQRQGWGRVVAVGSSGVHRPIPGLALSNVFRSALAGLLKTLAAEVAADGVTVNMVHPGRIATDRVFELDRLKGERLGMETSDVARDSAAAIPMGRYGQPAEFAAAVAFLCSDKASYVTGIELRVDGGMVGSR